MDWVPNSDLFVAPNRIDEFDCELDVKNTGQCCKVVQSYSVVNAVRLSLAMVAKSKCLRTYRPAKARLLITRSRFRMYRIGTIGSR
jgi:hypothetical protein